MNKRNIIKLGTRIVIIFVILVIIYIAYTMIYKVNSIDDLFKNIENQEAYVSEYTVYGTHLNIKGKLEIDNNNVKEVKLCLNTINQENPDEIPIKFSINEKDMLFSTSELINEGIDLEELKVNMYYLILKIEYNDNTIKYYSLKDNTEYKKDSIEYYTITKNSKNRKIDIGFAKHVIKKQDINYMSISVNHSTLPDNVYDVVIDPGHGGKDVGAEAGKYNESSLNLKIAKEVKKELEELGLKVRITRDGNEGDEYNVYTVYDNNGRVNVTGNSKAKYVFSIHLNSIEEKNSQSGVEIYAPSKTNLEFAKAFADNIVKFAKTKYSGLEVDYKKDNGVYVRTLTEEDISESNENAKKNGYEPYNIGPETPYLYMIRETGGLITGAYVDGRNKHYGKNLYYDSNVGVEAYLLELGYINSDTDLQNILINQSGYVEGIVKTIKNKLLGENYIPPVKKDKDGKEIKKK